MHYAFLIMHCFVLRTWIISSAKGQLTAIAVLLNREEHIFSDNKCHLANVRRRGAFIFFAHNKPLRNLHKTEKYRSNKAGFIKRSSKIIICIFYF